MTHEELVAEIQTLQAFSQTWSCKNVRIFDKNSWYWYCYNLMLHYLSDKEEVDKDDLKLFDVLYPDFSKGITAVMFSKEQVREEYLKKLKVIRNRTDLIDDKWLYSYNVATGNVERLDIIVRWKNGKSVNAEECDFSTDYDLFKVWLFTTLTKYGEVPGIDKMVYYIDSMEWEIVKENFPRMVRRLTVGSTDICTFKDYYHMKKREKELEECISRVEADSENATYLHIQDSFKKLKSAI